MIKVLYVANEKTAEVLSVSLKSLLANNKNVFV